MNSKRQKRKAKQLTHNLKRLVRLQQKLIDVQTKHIDTLKDNLAEYERVSE